MKESKVLNLNVDNFNKEVLESDMPVLVDFWAPWCTPCLMMAPVLDELSVSMGEKIKVAKLDVDDPSNQNLAISYRIQSIPNMKLFKKGEVIGEFIGLRNLEDISQEIESFL